MRCPPSGLRSFHALSCRRQFAFLALLGSFDWRLRARRTEYERRRRRTRSHPTKSTTATSTTYMFRASEAGSRCRKVNGGKAAALASPYWELGGPADGTHGVYLIHRMPDISTSRDAPSPGQFRGPAQTARRSLQRRQKSAALLSLHVYVRVTQLKNERFEPHSATTQFSHTKLPHFRGL